MAVSEQSRERILARIKSALRAPTEPPDPTPIPYRDIYVVGDALQQRFEMECTANLTECHFTDGPSATAALLREIVVTLPAGPVYVQDAPPLRKLSPQWNREIAWSSAGGPPEPSQACVTLCEALVAQTGSILVSASTGGRGASVVAPVHIVVARVEQLVPGLETALRHACERGLPKSNSFLGLITGSSRTADIEKILVQGAHGPRRVVVVVEKG